METQEKRGWEPGGKVGKNPGEKRVGTQEKRVVTQRKGSGNSGEKRVGTQEKRVVT